jgi:hypothetical protein
MLQKGEKAYGHKRNGIKLEVTFPLPLSISSLVTIFGTAMTPVEKVEAMKMQLVYLHA